MYRNSNFLSALHMKTFSKLLTFSVLAWRPNQLKNSMYILGIYNFEYDLRHSEKQRERKMIVISNKEKDISRNLSLMILMTGACARTKIRATRAWWTRVAVSMQAVQASAGQGRRLGRARGQNFWCTSSIFIWCHRSNGHHQTLVCTFWIFRYSSFRLQHYLINSELIISWFCER